MPIRFRCEKCSQGLTISTRKQGATIVCPKCSQDTRVPVVSIPGLNQQTTEPENPSSKISTSEINSPPETTIQQANGKSKDRCSDSILDIDFDLMMANEATIDTIKNEDSKVIHEAITLQKFLAKQTMTSLIIITLLYTIAVISITSYITFALTASSKSTP